MLSVRTGIVLALCLSAVYADVSHIVGDHHQSTTTTPQPPPVPYAFSYTAGRFPGHVDRQHTEHSDGSGTVRGIFQYVDPRNQVRTVEYQADENGFHPALSHVPEPNKDTEAVERVKQRHHELYEKISEHHKQLQNYPQIIEHSLPRETHAVANARQHHLSLFEKIAAEHEQLAAQREAERILFESTSIKNELQAPEEESYQQQYGHH